MNSNGIKWFFITGIICILCCQDNKINYENHTFFLCFKSVKDNSYPCLDTIKNDDSTVMFILGPVEKTDLNFLRKKSVIATTPSSGPSLIPESTIVFCDVAIFTRTDTIPPFTNIFGHIREHICTFQIGLCDESHLVFEPGSFIPQGKATFNLRAMDNNSNQYFDTFSIYVK